MDGVRPLSCVLLNGGGVCCWSVQSGGVVWSAPCRVWCVACEYCGRVMLLSCCRGLWRGVWCVVCAVRVVGYPLFVLPLTVVEGGAIVDGGVALRGGVAW